MDAVPGFMFSMFFRPPTRFGQPSQYGHRSSRDFGEIITTSEIEAEPIVMLHLSTPSHLINIFFRPHTTQPPESTAISHHIIFTHIILYFRPLPRG